MERDTFRLREAGRERRLPRWPRRRAVRVAGNALLLGTVFPMLRAGYTLKVNGRENVEQLDEPALIVSNHNLHLDQALLLKSLPGRVRRKIAIAAAESDIFGNRVRGFTAALLGNAFPFANSGTGIRGSMENVIDMLGGGWNVLLFPEGRLTVGGPTQRFKQGAARLARDTGAPVLPMRIDLVRPGMYEGTWRPNPRGRVLVNIGAPFRVEPTGTVAEATRLLEQAVLEA